MAVYGYQAYAKEMVNIVTGYIGAGLLLLIVFPVCLFVWRYVRAESKCVILILLGEIAVLVITGISFVCSGFLVLSLLVPGVLLGTLCGLREKNIIFKK